MLRARSIPALAVMVAGLFLSSAYAQVVTYSLSNKNPGGQAPPDYGLRVDGLFGETGSIWTFDFNSTEVWMDVDVGASTAHIYGTVYGGKDVGTSWDPLSGYEWYLDFTYNDITITDPTTGFWHAADVGGNHINVNNTGWLRLDSIADVDGNPGTDDGQFIALADYKGGDFFLHSTKGPYVSAWHAATTEFVADPSTVVPGTGPYDYNRTGACCKDFGFVATPVPEPEIYAMMGIGMGVMGWVARRKRRRSALT